MDIDLGAESGFDLARRIDLDEDVRSHVILISTHAEEDFSDLIATSPALGFMSKSRLSSDAIERILEKLEPCSPFAATVIARFAAAMPIRVYAAIGDDSRPQFVAPSEVTYIGGRDETY